MARNIIGIDLGSSSTLIWTKDDNSVIFNEPTVLAWDKLTHKVFEIGYLAHKLLGKVPEGMEIVEPMKNGAVGDIEATVAFLYKAFDNLHKAHQLKGADMIISAPSSLTKVEKDALGEVAARLGGKTLHIIESSKAAALGSGVNVYSTRGNMVIDIGGARADISALTMGRVVVSDSCLFAGNSADEAIMRYVRTKHHLMIGPKTAEYVKMKIGTLLENSDNNLLEISGRDLITGLPHSVIISTLEISELLIKVYSEIVNHVVDTLEAAPAEISADVIHTGVTLSGGGCLLNGAREFFEKQLSVPVHISPYPLEATIQGIKSGYESILKEPAQY